LHEDGLSSRFLGKDSKKKGKPRKIKRKPCEMGDFPAAPRVFPYFLTEKQLQPAGSNYFLRKKRLETMRLFFWKKHSVSADLLIRSPNGYKHLQMRPANGFKLVCRIYKC